VCRLFFLQPRQSTPDSGEIPQLPVLPSGVLYWEP
jgi:hypothetical protein